MKLKYNKNLLFQKLREFKKFIEIKSKIKLVSFKTHPYIENQENYKYHIQNIARENLQILEWHDASYKLGNIRDKVVKAIEIKGNNLYQWDTRYGKPKHKILDELRVDELKKFEEYTYNFAYNNILDETYFKYLLSLFGKSYSLLAYIFFIKDYSRYLPIAPNIFDSFFREIEFDFKTSRRCSWDNYLIYLDFMKDVKYFLEENLNTEISLLDAHSFCWICSRQMKKESKNHIKDYFISESIKEKQRETIINARTGQGQFRKDLLIKWNYVSSVSNFNNDSFLIASHIKPWKECTNSEAIDVDNGLLLTPNLDKAFDLGYISFNNKGQIIFSKYFTDEDKSKLNISDDIFIKEVNPKMKVYLEYHRQHILKK